jgi:hypothetical protein
MLDDTGLNNLLSRYEGVLALTPSGARVANTPSLADAARDAYAATRFARLPDILPPPLLVPLLLQLAEILTPVLQRAETFHSEKADGSLSFGSSFKCVDTARLTDPAARATLETLLGQLGFTAFAEALGARLSSVIRHVAGEVFYQRAYLYMYGEGDYLSAHDDRHVGERVDVQFPVCLHTVSGIRVLSEGLFRMQYDVAGGMNILGPSMWHDVPPLLRTSSAEPRRINLGLRFASC